MAVVGAVAGWTAPCLPSPWLQRGQERQKAHGLREQLVMVSLCHIVKAAAVAFLSLATFFIQSLESEGRGWLPIRAEGLLNVCHHNRRVQGNDVVDGSCSSQEISPLIPLNTWVTRTEEPREGLQLTVFYWKDPICIHHRYAYFSRSGACSFFNTMTAFLYWLFLSASLTALISIILLEAVISTAPECSATVHLPTFTQ